MWVMSGWPEPIEQSFCLRRELMIWIEMLQILCCVYYVCCNSSTTIQLSLYLCYAYNHIKWVHRLGRDTRTDHYQLHIYDCTYVPLWTYIIGLAHLHSLCLFHYWSYILQCSIWVLEITGPTESISRTLYQCHPLGNCISCVEHDWIQSILLWLHHKVSS